MAKKSKTTDEKLSEYRSGIISEIEHWESINQNGCNDPFWQDGYNMNLTRNHIIYFKRMIAEICQEIGASFPEEYYLPTPPEVDNSYMANLKQTSRIERMRQFDGKITTSRVNFDTEQLSFI